MDRKKFLKKSLLGLFGLAAGATITSESKAEKKVEMEKQVGFNHLPKKEESKMKTVLHKANSRGHANHGWLDSHHSFSFASYYNPDRMGFGALRVLNDDQVAAGRGFGRHPHDNMEIISIPLAGDLEHQDSMGNKAVIKEGDVQVMSAGTGIQHSEYNRNKDEQVKFLQIWVFPNKKNVKPRYDQITLDKSKMKNQLHQILSPSADDEGVWIHQDAWFHLSDLDAGTKLDYQFKKSGNGVYAFVLSGSLKLAGQQLENRDGMGVWNTDQFEIEATSNSRILLMEVPMG